MITRMTTALAAFGLAVLTASASVAQFWNPVTAAGRAALDAVVTQQAQVIAFLDGYKLLMIAALAAIPLLVVFRRPSGGGRPDAAVALD